MLPKLSVSESSQASSRGVEIRFSRGDHSIPSLDGLRAISIFLVILAHILGSRGIQSDPVGNLGVRVFFVISGFLITTLLLKELERSGKINLVRFYVRRSLRIFPAFYSYLITLAILAAAGAIILQPFDLRDSGLYIINYSPWDLQSIFVRHIWSLANEEQFYLLWPVCMMFLGARKSAWIALAAIVIAPFVRFGVFEAGPPALLTIDRRFDCIADTLAAGCLLACWKQKLSANRAYHSFLRSAWFLLVPVAVTAASFSQIHPRVYYLVSETVINIGIALMIDWCIRYPRFGAGALLNTAPLRQVGVMSYSIYLWQQLFLCGEPGWWHAFPVNLLLTAAAATGSFYLIETPFQRLKNRVARA